MHSHGKVLAKPGFNGKVDGTWKVSDPVTEYTSSRCTIRHESLPFLNTLGSRVCWPVEYAAATDCCALTRCRLSGGCCLGCLTALRLRLGWLVGRIEFSSRYIIKISEFRPMKSVNDFEQTGLYKVAPVAHNGDLTHFYTVVVL